jgi:hypothetical protein
MKDSTKIGFKMTLPWTKNFMKTHLNKSYKVATTIIKKLP